MQTNLILGDCFEELPKLKDNSVELVLVDPPYNLSFLGKDWDTIKNFQEWTTNWAVEAHRILKPGGFLLAFGGTRQAHRLACGIEDAGFICKDAFICHGIIAWTYSSGFPKALDISKQLDKMAGKEREVIGKTSVCGTFKQKHQIEQGYRPENNRGGYKGEREGAFITAPATPEAKEWEGWKSCGLKPSYEIIYIFQKKIEKGLNISQNVLKHGTGAINVDISRIGATNSCNINENSLTLEHEQTTSNKTSSENAHLEGDGTNDVSGLRKGVSSREGIHEGSKEAPNLWEGMQGEVNEKGERSELEGREVCKEGRICSDLHREEEVRDGTQASNGEASRKEANREGDSPPHKREQAGQQHRESGTDKRCGDSHTDKTQQQKPGDRENPAQNLGRFPSNTLLIHHFLCKQIGVKKVKGSHSKGKGAPNGIPKNQIVKLGGGQCNVDYVDKDGKETVPNFQCHPDCMVSKLDKDSGELGYATKPQTKDSGKNSIFGIGDPKNAKPELYGKQNSGTASRFFKQFTYEPIDITPFKYCAKASKSEKNKGLEGLYILKKDVPEETVLEIKRCLDK